MTHPRERFARLLPEGARVLDVGCWGYGFRRYCEELGIRGLRHCGIDREPLAQQPPAGYEFARVDLEREPFPFESASFDAVYASHVLEHLSRPLALTDEAFRVLKPGGLFYLETPSERSLWLPSMPFRLEESRSLSFWDDPTHVGRPQTPQSLHRLFRMYGAEVVAARRIVFRAVQWRLPYLLLKACWSRDAALLEDAVWKGCGFAVFGIARKTGDAPRRYVLS